MEIGTHNAMSYLPPKKWYLYPFRFIAKCQSLSIEKQFNKGIRLFDIRISYDKKHNLEFRHGLMAFKGDVYKTLNWLNSQNEPIKIRLILETKEEDIVQEILFIIDIYKFQSEFPNLTFYEGRRKYDWHKLVDLPDLEVIQLISSMQGNKIDWPWLYAKKHNKKNFKKYAEEITPILFDFIK